MKRPIAIALLLLAPFLAPLPCAAAEPETAGLVTRDSPYPVPETVAKIEDALGAKGVKVFARIDHAGEAKAAGLELSPTQLLIFGNPKAGTPLMQQAPTIAIDLPLKVLVWQDDQSQVHVSWNSPDYLTGRHGLPAEAGKPLAAVGVLIEAAIQ
jgi:uncharacterized protein (DUF302 family)